MTIDTKTEVHSNGLRYASKKPGSPFGPMGAGGYGALSCFFCGTHRHLSERKMQKILGRHQPVCEPVCQKNPAARKKPR